MRRPRVLMVTGAYYPEVTGAALQCRALIRALQDEAAFTVCSMTAPSTLRGCDTVDGVPVYRLFVRLSRRWSQLAALIRLVWTVTRLQRRVDIVHLHGFSRKSLVVVLLAKLFRKRVVLKLTSVGHDDPAAIRQRGRFAFWCYTKADRVVGVSPGLERLYRASGLPQDKFRLIPNGVDLERFKPRGVEAQRALRATLGLSQDLVWILFVGFFSREKRPDLLFDAWMRLQGDGVPGTGLVFVGATEGPYEEIDPTLFPDLQNRARRVGLAHRVVSVPVTQTIEQYYGAADCFALPSVREGMPNALLEAMASGLPCIAARLPGVTDALIDDRLNGLLVEPGDPAAMACALRAVLQEPQRARTLGERARKTVETRYAMAQTAAAYRTMYRELL